MHSQKISWKRIVFFYTVWKGTIWKTITFKKFREINSLVTSLVKTLIWWKKCSFFRQNGDRVFDDFSHCVLFTPQIFRENVVQIICDLSNLVKLSWICWANNNQLFSFLLRKNSWKYRMCRRLFKYFQSKISSNRCLATTFTC